MKPTDLVRTLIIASGVAGAIGIQQTHGQAISRNRVAAHQLGFSGVVVSIREDYRETHWPVARRTLILDAPNGKRLTWPLHNGGANELTALNLYHRERTEYDKSGHAIDGEFVLVGARDCVAMDPVFLVIFPCKKRPPCDLHGKAELTYLGRYDWANGYDPPQGRFQYGWRFLPLEDGSEASFCPTVRAEPKKPGSRHSPG